MMVYLSSYFCFPIFLDHIFIFIIYSINQDCLGWVSPVLIFLMISVITPALSLSLIVGRRMLWLGPLCPGNIGPTLI